MLSALLALASAFVFGTGVALQLKAALEVPQEYALRLGLLTRLIRRPLWLLGLLCDIAGFALQAAALAMYREATDQVEQFRTDFLRVDAITRAVETVAHR